MQEYRLQHEADNQTGGKAGEHEDNALHRRL